MTCLVVYNISTTQWPLSAGSKKGDAVYLAKVETYREEGKVKQRFLEYVGKEEQGLAVQKVDVHKMEATSVQQCADISVLYQLALQLKLNCLLGKHRKTILALVIAHLICKGSILSLSHCIEHSSIKEITGLEELTTGMLYESLDHLEACDFGQIGQNIFEYWRQLAPQDNKTFVLDVTDTYCSGGHDPSVARREKDGKVSKLVQIGLGVSFEHGFPVFLKTYPGNISTIKILEDLLRVMAARDIHPIVMDRGFYSEANVKNLNRLKMKVIVGVKQSMGIRKNILDFVDRDKIYTAKNQVKLMDTFVYVQEVPFLFGKMIVIYNPKCEIMKRGKLLAEGARDSEVRYVGYSLIFHNTVLKADAVVRKYFDKDIVERGFRSMKGEVHLHPIRLWLPRRVNAHIKICYLSLCLLSLIKFRCKKMNASAGEIMEELQSIYKVHLRHSRTGQEFTKVVTLSNSQKDILKALKCSV